MTAITKFEDLIAWQEARKLVSMIYKITLDGLFSKDFGLKDQIQRAAVSSMPNIAEGFDNESIVEFARFLRMARSSSVEVQSCYMLPWPQTISKKKLSRPIMSKPERLKPLSED